MKKILYSLIIILCFIYTCSNSIAQELFIPTDHSVIKTDRIDGRYLSSRGVSHLMLKNLKPKYAFDPNMTSIEFQNWKKEFREAMGKVMCHPKIENQPPPIKVGSIQRTGYKVEKWEIYPLNNCVSTFLVLIPDDVNESNPAPAVMCIPGSGSSKESLTAEPELHPKYESTQPFERRTMALHYVKAGLVAIAVDNPAVAEVSDLEKYTAAPRYNYDAVARELLEVGWSYLGYSSFIDMQILDWMKSMNYIDKNKIILSGHSLGTEPMMVIGVLDTSVYAIVYNDFLCRTLERMIVLTEPNDQGIRPSPNSIRHFIPNFLSNFDFPDIVAYFAPTPVICTEGGQDRDFRLVLKAYEIAGHPENFNYFHYPRFADPRVRGGFETMPEGINYETYYAMTNVDPPQHYFKYELVIPWIKKILNLE